MIIEGKKYGNPWDQIRSLRDRERRMDTGEAHGLTARQIEEMHNRMDSFMPQMVSPSDARRIDLPDGMTRSAQMMPGSTSIPGASIFSAGSGGNVFSTPQMPYQPEFSSPDRQQYPVHRILANRYWRLFHKLDPVAGNVIDLYAEMLSGQAELTGDGVDGEIKALLEEMIEETKVFSMFPHFVREFLILGEAVPHCFFDDDAGIWTFIAMHNPDQLEVIHSPFINMDPIVEYIPDDKLRQILSSSDPSLAKVRAMMPPELVGRLQSRQNIPLDPLNMTFIPRKLHPYDTRGTSIYSRLWRIFMYEDAVFSASIATARRHAGPLKIAKLGNPATGWIPGPEHERRLLELLTRAETDPHAFLVYHYGVQFEAFGTTDRMMSISREWDIIERIKMVALGVSKSFMHGEVTYASSVTGLQVFLQRLLAMRSFFESEWWYPKFFRPVSEINEWVRPTSAELSHRVRVRRTAKELRRDDRYIVPTLMWDRKLDPHIDSALLDAIQKLEMLGLKISKGTKAAAGGFNYEDEANKVVQETKFEQEIGLAPPPMLSNIMGTVPGQPTGAPRPPAAQPQVPQAPKQPAAPQAPAQQPVQAPQEVSAPIPPAPASPQAPKPGQKDDRRQPVDIGSDDRPVSKAGDLADLKDLLITGETDNERWLPLRNSAQFMRLIDAEDWDEVWDYIDEYMANMEGADDDEIERCRKELVLARLIPPRDIDKLREVEDRLPDDAGSLSDEALQAALSGQVLPFKRDQEEDRLLVGVGSGNPYRRANYSISELMEAKRAGPECNRLHSHDHSPFVRGGQIKTPDMEDPDNYESRAEWQKGLDRIPIPDDAKRYIKQMENTVTDGWENSFDAVWQRVEDSLNRGMPITTDVLIELMSGGIRELGKSVTRQDIKNALMGVYHNGKLYAYEPTNFEQKKQDRLAKRGMRKVSVTIDTLDDRIIIDTISNSALSKVKTIGDKDLRKTILDRLVDPTMVEKNPISMANEVVREERKRKEEGRGLDTESRKQLRDELRKLYEDQLWKIERIMRTESLGAYWAATLRGYEEQGIKKIRFNSHHDHKVCTLCKGFNGTEFNIDELLKLPHPLLAQLTHPNCRCWPTPIITGLTFEEFEKEYMAQPERFPEAYHGFDPNVLAIEDVLKDVHTKTTQFQNAPVEEAESLEGLANNVIVKSPFRSNFPDNVQFVADVAEHPEFVKTVAPAEDMRNQVVSWTSPTGVTFVSMFSVEKGDATSTMVRTWAQNIWDERPEIRKQFGRLFEDAGLRTIPDDIQPGSALKMATTFGPDMVGKKTWVGIAECVSLNKRFRDKDDRGAKAALRDLGIDDKDVETVAMWRRFNPVWEIESGRFIENDVPATLNRFVSAQAGDDAQSMFIESMVYYVKDGIRLQSRDPETYEILKNEIFANKEFIDKPSLH